MDEKKDENYKIWLKKYLVRYWYLLVTAFLLSTVSIVLELASPLPMKFLADYVFGSSRMPNLWNLNSYDKSTLLIITVVAFLVIGVIKGFFILIKNLILRKMHQVIDKRSMDEAFSAVNSIPYNHPNRKDNGNYLYQITNQSQQISTYYLTDLITIVQSILMISGILFILANIDVEVALITFTTIPFLLLSVVWFGRILLTKANRTETAHSNIYNIINETLDKLRTIQAFAKENLRLNILNKAIVYRNKKANSQLLSSGIFSFSNGFIILASTSLALIIGGTRALNGKITFGDLLLFIAYMNILFDPLVGLVESIGSMRAISAALRQVSITLEDAHSLHLTSGEIKDSAIRGEITFKKVTYTIGDKPILNDVNLTIAPGTFNAFIGPSGAGKSTLINLILRFASPDRGWINIDGKNISEYDTHFLRENIALVEQEPDIFNLSFKDNIALSNPDEPYNLPDVMGAAAVANIAEIIDAEAGKYDTIVNNNKLSGGQKQRLAMARAIYKRAPIVLLDEPTSALDKKAVEIFSNNVFEYLKGKTVMMVTHEISLLQKVPNIYVVQDGTIRPISEYGGLDAYRDTLTKNRPA